MDVREIGWECVDWIDVAQDRGQWQVVVNGNEPEVPKKGGEFLDYLSDYYLLKNSAA
jgi:hypothetical protein